MHARVLNRRQERVEAEGRREVDDRLAWRHEQAHHQVDKLVAARARDQPLGLEARVAAQRLAHAALLRVGVDVIRRRLRQRLDCPGRGSVGVLVGVELDDALRRDAEALRDLLRRLDRHVGRHGTQMRPHQARGCRVRCQASSDTHTARRPIASLLVCSFVRVISVVALRWRARGRRGPRRERWRRRPGRGRRRCRRPGR